MGEREQDPVEGTIAGLRASADASRLRLTGDGYVEAWVGWSFTHAVNLLSRTLERARREDEALAEIEVWESIPGADTIGPPVDLAEIRRRKARLEPRWR